MQLIDSHAHLTSPQLADHVDAVLRRAVDAGVSRIITIATTIDDAQAAIALARRSAGQVFVGAGWHPHEAGKVSVRDVKRMAAFWSDDDVVAVGEIGLDYHYDFADCGTQRRVFAEHLRLAKDVDIPVVIHSREAMDDTIAILEESGFAGRRVVFHCFGGSEDEAAAIADRGWRISFTGVVTFKKSDELRAIARAYPDDKIMLETDCPYLSPVPVRGRTNEPAHLAHIAACLAAERQVDVPELAAQTTRNTESFFGLPARDSA